MLSRTLDALKSCEHVLDDFSLISGRYTSPDKKFELSTLVTASARIAIASRARVRLSDAANPAPAHPHGFPPEPRRADRLRSAFVSAPLQVLSSTIRSSDDRIGLWISESVKALSADAEDTKSALNQARGTRTTFPALLRKAVGAGFPVPPTELVKLLIESLSRDHWVLNGDAIQQLLVSWYQMLSQVPAWIAQWPELRDVLTRWESTCRTALHTAHLGAARTAIEPGVIGRLYYPLLQEDLLSPAETIPIGNAWIRQMSWHTERRPSSSAHHLALAAESVTVVPPIGHVASSWIHPVVQALRAEDGDDQHQTRPIFQTTFLLTLLYAAREHPSTWRDLVKWILITSSQEEVRSILTDPTIIHTLQTRPHLASDWLQHSSRDIRLLVVRHIGSSAAALDPSSEAPSLSSRSPIR